MFHLALRDIAEIIVRDQLFKAGSGGSAGAACYFCAHADECAWKANLASGSDTQAVCAEVRLGSMLLKNHSVSDMTYDKLKRLGCDSVCLTFFRGNEYVVYPEPAKAPWVDGAQIRNIRLFDPKQYVVPTFPRSANSPPTVPPPTGLTFCGRQTFSNLNGSGLLSMDAMTQLRLEYIFRLVIADALGVPSGAVQLLRLQVGSVIVDYSVELDSELGGATVADTDSVETIARLALDPCRWGAC